MVRQFLGVAAISIQQRKQSTERDEKMLPYTSEFQYFWVSAKE